MTKFKDLPDTSTPLSADNLNSICPIGAITMWGVATPPRGWLICNGAEVSRTEYADLFAVIGTYYGSGNGSTTFNLPNLMGKVPVGLDSTQTEFDTLGEAGGEKTHQLTSPEMPEHIHLLTANDNISAAAGSGYYHLPSAIEGYAAGTAQTIFYNSTKTSIAGENQAHNNLQPYIVLNYIIKF